MAESHEEQIAHEWTPTRKLRINLDRPKFGYPNIAIKCDLQMSIIDKSLRILVNDYVSSRIQNVVYDNLDTKTKNLDVHANDVIYKFLFNCSWKNDHSTKPVLNTKINPFLIVWIQISI